MSTDSENMKPAEEHAENSTRAADPVHKQKGAHLIRPKWLRVLLKTLMWIIIVILLLPVVIYIPPVQTLLKDTACSIVKKSTGMDVSIERFRLRWPVDIDLQGVKVLEANGDTMVVAKNVIADVKLMPLLHLDVKINKLSLRDAYYRMVSADSSMVMKLRAGDLTVDSRSSVNIATSEILINEATMSKGSISLYMNVWKQKPSPTDSTVTPFLIKAKALKLRDVDFAMSMLPTIDTLTLHAESLDLSNGIVDLRNNNITASLIAGHSGKVAYITPTAEYIAKHPAPVDTTSASAPMTIKADSISLDGFNVLYAVKEAKPQPGFDASYMSFSNLAIGLRDFYNRSSEVKLPVTRLQGEERCGLKILSGKGVVGVDSTGLAINDLAVTTSNSSIKGSATVPFALMALNPDADMNASIEASIGQGDIIAFMPSLATTLKPLPQAPINLNVDASGSLADIEVNRMDLEMPGALRLFASGSARNVLDFKKLIGEIEFEGAITNGAFISKLSGQPELNIPPLAIKGKATADMMNFGADFTLRSREGNVGAKGRVGLNSERYFVDADIEGVNVNKFMKDLPLSGLSASLHAEGAGFNPTRAHASTDASLRLKSADYAGHHYSGISADASLHDGNFSIALDSPDPYADLNVTADGRIDGETYTVNARAMVRNLDLKALGLSETMNSGSADIEINGTATPTKWLYDVDFAAHSVDWNLPDTYIHLPAGVNGHFLATEAATDMRLLSDGVALSFISNSGLQAIVEGVTKLSKEADTQIKFRSINAERLQALLPPFHMDLNVSGKGIIGRLIQPQGIAVDTIFASLSNDSLINLRATIRELSTSSLRFDTISLNIKQRGELFDYRTHLGNRKGNLPELASVDLNGYFGTNRLLASVTQRNDKGKMGYRLGFTAAVTDSLVTVHFTPLKAVIAYLPWTFNADNHIDYHFNNTVDANLLAKSSESSIELRTVPDAKGRDQLLVNIDNLHVQDFLNLSVFAPPITASIDSKMQLLYLPDKRVFIGSGNIGVRDFSYDKQKISDFTLNFKAGADINGNTAARAGLVLQGHEAMVLRGTVIGDTATDNTNLKLELLLTRFPLSLANPFLGKDIAQLRGVINGKMNVGGSLKTPLLNGSIAFDSAAVYIPMAGATLTLDTTATTVADNIITFNNFKILSANKNPLVISGNVDASSLTSIKFGLAMKARNFQLIGTDKRKGTDIYGKLFLDLDGSVKGPMDHFDVKANLKIKGTTDLGYNLTMSESEITRQTSGDIVKFVNLSDTTQLQKADSLSSSMAMRIIADLAIDPGTRITVNLSNNGTDRVELSPSGNLNYFQNFMGDMRLNGQLMLGNGFARYSIPVVGEKMFTFNPSSSVTWNGDLMNPTLNIKATDQVKANVQQSGSNSRLINFLVNLSVTNNLRAPRIQFDLSTNDDMTVQNELQSMSADQRSNQAMNLLLYGQYTGPGTKANANLTGNPLYSFLESQLNSWAAKNIRGVDLSFGIDQYDSNVDGHSSTTTSYSYRVSKSLFSNKFKIIVGGNYSTDANANENFSQNLINDISFEYVLRETQNLSMYLKLFRHTGYESILEGEITEMGAGFVLKRRMSDWRRFFHFRFGRSKKSQEDASDTSTDEKGATHVEATDSITTKPSTL